MAQLFFKLRHDKGWGGGKGGQGTHLGLLGLP